MNGNWRAELERVFDVVSVETSPEGPIYRATYWEDDGRVDLVLSARDRTAEAVVVRGTAVERFRVYPLAMVRARTAQPPLRLDLDGATGGRLTLWFKPLGVSAAGAL